MSPPITAPNAPGARGKPKRPAWKDLRTCLWLHYALDRSGLELGAFGSRHIEQGRDRYTDSKLVYKWRSYKEPPSARWVAVIEKAYPGTRQIFDLPLYELLADAPITQSRLEKHVKAFKKRTLPPLADWYFPNSEWPITPLLQPWDTAPLVERGDLWGLFAIVASVRHAEATRDAPAHAERCKDMYRILPALFKHVWIRPAKELLRECLFGVRSRMPLSLELFSVDWGLIDELAAFPFYVPRRTERPRNPLTHRFIEYPDPIIAPWTVESLRKQGVTKG